MGVIAVAALILYGVRMQQVSRYGTMATAFAKARLEELRVTPVADPERQIGGDLAANVANHFDLPGDGTFIRRWVVAAGPAGTQDITVIVVPRFPSVFFPAVQAHALVRP